MKLKEVANKNRNVLVESCRGLDAKQRKIVEGVYNELTPLIRLSEAELTADQINQLFATVEKNAVAAGNNRTLVGKAIDIPGQVNQVINNVGKWLQDTKPVAAADQKFEQLKSAIGQKFPQLDQNLTAMGTWMKENPGKSAAIIGVLTAIASLAGGPAGGAIAGQILRGSAELIKGEKLSTAVGKGIKTAAFGFVAGKAFEMLGDWLGGLRANVVMQDKFATANWDATRSIKAPGFEWTKTIRGVNITVLPDDAETIKFLNDQIAQGGPGAVSAFDKLARLAEEIRQPDYKQMLADIGADARNNDSLYNFIQGAKEGLQAASQGAVAAATGGQPAQQPAQQPTPQTQSVIRTGNTINEYIDRDTTVRVWALNESLGRTRGGVHLNEHGINTLFDLAVNEGPMDALKKGAAAVGGAIKKGAQAVGAKAAEVGKNLTNKVTNSKLGSAWKKAGSPTDSEKIAQILQGAGVDDEVIKSSYASMKLPAPNLPVKQPQASPAGKAAAAAVAGTMAAASPAAAPASTAPSAQPSPPAASAPAAAQPANSKGGFWSGFKQGYTGKAPENDGGQAADQQPTASVPAGPAPTGDASAANAAANAGSSTATAGAETDANKPAAEPAKPMSVNDFAAKLQADFEAFAAAGGSIGAPAMKRALKSMWMQAGGIKAESKYSKKNPK